MPSPTLIDVLVRTAASAGCAEPTRLRHALELAADKRLPLVEALVDANLVDEDRFFAQLATGLGMPFSENGIADAAEGLHSRFPAKLALRHRICPAQVANGEVTILTYNPFDLSARQAVGQELRKRVHWQIAPRHRILEALHQGYGLTDEAKTRWKDDKLNFLPNLPHANDPPFAAAHG
jgi:general secretion pathway protein E/type IV pilus assembly protein PilB